MKRSDLIRIDHSGKVLEGGKNRLVNRAAIMIHAASKAWQPASKQCVGQLTQNSP